MAQPHLQRCEPSPANPHRATAIADFAPEGDCQGAMLAFSSGDVIWVIQKDASGWWGGYKDGSDETGWFPSSAVRMEDCSKDMAPGFDGNSFQPCHEREAPPESALRTSDNRAVASPQAGHARRLLQVQALQAQLDLSEKEQEAWRNRAAEAEAKSSALAQDLKREQAEREKDREDFECRLREVEQQRLALDREVQRLRREKEQAEAKEKQRVLETQRSASALTRSMRSSEDIGLSSRAQSPALGTRLFHQGDGTRTPPVPTIPQLAATPMSSSAPTVPLGLSASMTATQLTSSRTAQPGLVSGQPPRPSPRVANWDCYWASSPTRSQTSVQQLSPVRSLAATGGDSPTDAPPPQVRQLVTQFEKRGVQPQSAPHARTEQPPVPPPRPVAFSPAVPAMQFRPPGTSVARAVSREAPPVLTGYSTPDIRTSAGYAYSEERSGNFNLGMSPLQRRVQQQPAMRAGLSSLSPSRTIASSLSVKDKINRFQGVVGQQSAHQLFRT